MTPDDRQALLGGRFVVRRATEADVPALVALLRDDPIGADRETAEPSAYLTAFRAVDADPAHLLAVVDGPAGPAAATLQLTLLPGLSRGGVLRAQIEAVRVAEPLRGAGLGSALLRWAIEEAGRRGAGLVQLTTDLRRDDALRLYRRLGFAGTHLGLKLEPAARRRPARPSRVNG